VSELNDIGSVRVGSDYVAAKKMLRWRFYVNVETMKSRQWGVLGRKSDRERR